MGKKTRTMRKQSIAEVRKKRKTRDAIYEMMRDMIKWEYGKGFEGRSLLDVIRKRYTIKMKTNHEM